MRCGYLSDSLVRLHGKLLPVLQLPKFSELLKVRRREVRAGRSTYMVLADPVIEHLLRPSCSWLAPDLCRNHSYHW